MCRADRSALGDASRVYICLGGLGCVFLADFLHAATIALSYVPLIYVCLGHLGGVVELEKSIPVYTARILEVRTGYLVKTRRRVFPLLPRPRDDV